MSDSVCAWLVIAAVVLGMIALFDIAPRLFRYYRNRVTPESRIRALRPLSNGRRHR